MCVYGHRCAPEFLWLHEQEGCVGSTALALCACRMSVLELALESAQDGVKAQIFAR
ncbi:hypothetical protein AZE42_11410 [Rhizopogon vesiculosus]|uniref:Uncharacterized protein n=1 Tax=Rhizopogon vesiculosus TaxID=180088 RepID=A0A1J8PXH2_9AGAM|nr:hypothetical protein AZE42_11410 [Rhizopogon vesiculosus]